MIKRALDIAATSSRGANYVPEQVPTMSWNQTLPPLPSLTWAFAQVSVCSRVQFWLQGAIFGAIRVLGSGCGISNQCRDGIRGVLVHAGDDMGVGLQGEGGC